METKMRSTTTTTIQKTEEVYEADPALSYDEENPDDEKSEVEAYDAEINEIVPDDLGEEVELSEDDEEERLGQKS